MNDLIYATSQTFSNVSDSVDLAFEFSGSVVLIDLDSPQKKSTWNKAGNILQTVNMSSVSARAEVSDSYSFLGFNPTLLRFTPLEGNTKWRLRFKPVPWLTEFTLTVWQSLPDIFVSRQTYWDDFGSWNDLRPWR